LCKKGSAKKDPSFRKKSLERHVHKLLEYSKATEVLYCKRSVRVGYGHTGSLCKWNIHIPLQGRLEVGKMGQIKRYGRRFFGVVFLCGWGGFCLGGGQFFGLISPPKNGSVIGVCGKGQILKRLDRRKKFLYGIFG